MIRNAGLLLIGVLVAAAPGCVAKKAPVVKTEPPVVTVGKPVEAEVTDYEDFTGRTDAVFTVEVRARVTGYLDKAVFKDGDEVKEGDLLFEIDPRPYKAELDRSEASVAQSEAHLKRLDADYRRASSLFTRGNISREEFDKAAGDKNEAEAAVGIAQAMYERAKLDVAFTKITAPISGRLSRRLVDPGNLVKADETSLTTIVSLDPMYVYFDVDERTLLRLRRLVSEGKIPTRQTAEIPIYAALSDETDYPHKGIINFSENKVDPSTGTLRVRASIDNPKPYVLSPGLFARVRLPIGQPRKSVLVAEKALGTEQGQKFVYVVGKDNKVSRRDVKVGRLDGRMRVVEEGLSTDEMVVTEGLQRIRPGATVDPKPESSTASGPEKKDGGKIVAAESKAPKG